MQRWWILIRNLKLIEIVMVPLLREWNFTFQLSRPEDESESRGVFGFAYVKTAYLFKWVICINSPQTCIRIAFSFSDMCNKLQMLTCYHSVLAFNF